MDRFVNISVSVIDIPIKVALYTQLCVSFVRINALCFHQIRTLKNGPLCEHFCQCNWYTNQSGFMHSVVCEVCTDQGVVIPSNKNFEKSIFVRFCPCAWYINQRDVEHLVVCEFCTDQCVVFPSNNNFEKKSLCVFSLFLFSLGFNVCPIRGLRGVIMSCGIPINVTLWQWGMWQGEKGATLNNNKLTSFRCLVFNVL